MAVTNIKDPSRFADAKFRKGFQQGCNYGISILDQLVRNGFTYDEAKAICMEFVNSELGKYLDDVDSYGQFPPHPQLLCEATGQMTLMTYDKNGNLQSRSYNPTRTIGLGITLRGSKSISSIIGGFVWDLLQRENEVPNRLTIFMGERIRTFRIEDKLSQEELAEKSYLSKGVLQAIEEGKVEITVSNLIYFSIALNRPIISFLPPDIIQYLDPQYLSLEERELLILLHQIGDEEREHKLIQIRSLIQGG
jgi:transcriptional regulator with XRE-family HTH domain